MSAEQVITSLKPQLTGERIARIESVLHHRTFALQACLENIYDRGNASAVFRSSEAFGFQGVHLIETGEKFKNANRVSKGAEKWLYVKKWTSTTDCLEHMKSLGYFVACTSLSATSVPLQDLDFTRPTLLIFGNEKDGISPEALAMSDAQVQLPMHGFVQSFNISVAAALSFQLAHEQRTRRLGQNGDLTEAQKQIIRAIYFLQTRDSLDWSIRDIH